MLLRAGYVYGIILTILKKKVLCVLVLSKDAERLGDELSLQRMKSLSESQRALGLERKLFTSERLLKQVKGCPFRHCVLCWCCYLWADWERHQNQPRSGRPRKMTAESADIEVHSVQRSPTFCRVNRYRPPNFMWPSD